MINSISRLICQVSNEKEVKLDHLSSWCRAVLIYEFLELAFRRQYECIDKQKSAVGAANLSPLLGLNTL